MKTFTRDSTIHLKFNFKNADSELVNPVAATVSISFMPVNYQGVTTIVYPLVQSGNDWVYECDSSMAAPCVVYAHAETADGPPTSSIDVEFRLKANRANRQLAGDW